MVLYRKVLSSAQRQSNRECLFTSRSWLCWKWTPHMMTEDNIQDATRVALAARVMGAGNDTEDLQQDWWSVAHRPLNTATYRRSHLFSLFFSQRSTRRTTHTFDWLVGGMGPKNMVSLEVCISYWRFHISLNIIHLRSSKPPSRKSSGPNVCHLPKCRPWRSWPLNLSKCASLSRFLLR